MSVKLFSLLVLVLLAHLAMSQLVPRIQSNNVRLEPIGDKKYSLRINDIGVVREESVEELSAGQFLVKGQLNQQYFPQSGRLIVIYEAGPNGYVAKYSYVKEPGQQMPPLGLTANALKAAAG